jgi:type IV pilus assembly protein PilZ
VSLGGVFLLSAEQLPLGAMVVLAFELPALGPVELPGFVRWTNAEGFGVQFGLIGARETHAIGRIVRGSNPG